MPEKWSLEGTYFEACNCEAACPCVFLSPPTEGACQVLNAWHIEEGGFGDVKLDGLNIMLYVNAPGLMTDGGWRVALYVDERADEAQKDALTQIFSGKAGGHPSVLFSFVEEVLGVKSVPIDYRAEGKRRSLRIPEVVEADILAIVGVDGGDVTISNTPLGISPQYPSVAAKSERVTFGDYGLELDVSGKNGFYSPFSYAGP